MYWFLWGGSREPLRTVRADPPVGCQQLAQQPPAIRRAEEAANDLA